MRILTVGDIVGENGVKKAISELRKIKKEKNIDFIIVNGENSAGGMGITRKIYDKLIEAGADVITMGNHTWGKKDIFTFINEEKNIIRPANYSRTSMGVLSENPFTVANDIIEKIKNNVDIIVVDFHAEATAEKIALGYYLDGKANIIFGTHTHVQTADETVLPKGTAYITDIGMTGPKYSVIGMDIKASIKRFETSLPERYKLAEGNCIFNSIIFEINDENGKIEKIERYNKI